jgi:RND family efflux transporter MFP subunit
MTRSLHQAFLKTAGRALSCGPGGGFLKGLPGARFQRFPTLPLCAMVLLASLPVCDAQKFSSDGVTEPVVDVTLSLPEPGIIAVERVKEGDFVSTNDVILRLDCRLEELEVERRRLVMENKKTDLESTHAVFDKSVSVSRDELLKKEADYNVAVTEYQIAQEQLRRRSLIAPKAGVITEIKLHAGEASTAYQPIVRLVDARRCYFISNVEAKQASRLKTGETVELQIEDLREPIKVRGEIIFVSPVVDPASGLQKVRVVFDNTDGRVRPGLVGQMSIE